MRLITAVAVVLSISACGTAGRRPPSVLLLVTDDQRADALGAAGHPLLRTPNLDRLAAEGVMFRNAFVTTSICAVSRASIFSGRYARRHGVIGFATPLPPDVRAASPPALLRAHGYRTALFGKWGIGGAEPRADFDVWDAWGGQGKYFHDVGGQRVHNSEYLARKADAFLRSTPAGQPFFATVLYKSPHDPYGENDPRDTELFSDRSVPTPPTASELLFNALPAFVQNSEGRMRAKKLWPTPQAYQSMVKNYLRLITSVDRSVGQLLATLDALDRAADTVVIFTSDNGFLLGEHGLSGKWLMYEESIRVPLVVRDPRIPASARGTRRDELVLNLDVAPTVLDIAGVAVPAGMDGRSLRPLLGNTVVPWREDFFYEHHYTHKGTIPRTEGVRNARWKYVRYLDYPEYRELYDVAGDPGETRNLARSVEHRAQLDALEARYQQYAATLPRGPDATDVHFRDSSRDLVLGTR